jgi:hypothetical protein
MTWLGIQLIRLYRYAVSPALPPACRFMPTCSQYAEDALREYGLLKGSWYALGRLLRCHPWHKGGHDPIQVRRSRETA